MADGGRTGGDRSSLVLIVLVVAVLAVGLWWFWSTGGVDESNVQVDQPAQVTPDLPDPGIDVPVEGIAEAPDTWMGMTVGGEVPVDEVVTSQVFWITDHQARVPVVVIPAAEGLPTVEAGQQVAISDARVQGPDWLEDRPAETVDEESRAALRGAPAFLVVEAVNLTPGEGV